MFDAKNIEILKNTTFLRETSRDDHDTNNIIYMTDSMLEVINFDKVKEKYIESYIKNKNLKLSETPQSNDALYIRDSGEMYFIEFKNGEISDKVIFELRLKIFDSLLILTDIIEKGISYTRQNLSYILVYDNSKINIRNFDVNRKLRRFKTLYFKDIFNVTKNEFKNNFIDDWEER